MPSLPTPKISVVIPTYDRAHLLPAALGSLAGQSLPSSEFEVVVIDDGSSDDTASVVESFRACLPIVYRYQRNAGIAVAKNHGIFVARGDLILFFDDDDVATPTLLERHVARHEENPEVNVAVLHRTEWSPGLAVTPLMHFVTEVSYFLFAYPLLSDGDVLDYTFFWGGRSSCKRELLVHHGVFDSRFRFGCEDIELGYRLAPQGLQVRYDAGAVAHMVRPVGFDDFCRRRYRQGRSQWAFSQLHPTEEIRRYTEVEEAQARWAEIEQDFDQRIEGTRRLDLLASSLQGSVDQLDAPALELLHEGYRFAFRAWCLKGIVDRSREDG